MMNENLRSKIKKLFEMAEMGTVNEAEVAFRMAHKLMAENGITQDDVKLYTIDFPAPKRKARWLTMLFDACGTFSGVCAMFMLVKFIYAGDEIGVNVARELFTYLKNEIDRQLKKQNIKGTKLKNSFRIGCVFGLIGKMEVLGGWRDMKDRRKRVQLTHYSNVKTHRADKIYVDGGAYTSGQAHGADININRQAAGVGASVGLIGGRNENE